MAMSAISGRPCIEGTPMTFASSMRAVPDVATLRRCPWDHRSSLVCCDLQAKLGMNCAVHACVANVQDSIMTQSAMQARIGVCVRGLCFASTCRSSRDWTISCA